MAGYDATDLLWRDGTRMPLSDARPAKSFDEMLRHGSILDQIRLPYPAGPIAAALVRGPSLRPRFHEIAPIPWVVPSRDATPARSRASRAWGL